MAKAVKFSDDAFVAAARAEAELHTRPLDEQLMHWARIGRAIENSESFDFSKIERVLAAEAATTTLTETERVVWSDMFRAVLSSPSADEVAHFEALRDGEGARSTDLERFRGRLPAGHRLSRDESHER